VLFREGQEYLQDKVTQRFIEFPTLELNWPVIEDVKSLNDCKNLFRLANT